MIPEDTVVMLRERMIGLPLERSIFDQLGTAGRLIGLESALPNGLFHAELDAGGSLHVDQSDVASLTAAFPTVTDDQFLRELDTERRNRCSALLDSTNRARDAAAAATDGRAAASDLLDRLTDFTPYPLLTKFVPDLLRDALVAQGASEIPTAPAPSPGMLLTQALERLGHWAVAAGLSADSVAGAWPDVPEIVEEVVGEFCEIHAGFGPVAWEAPGFDDGRYTLMAVASLGPLDGSNGRAERPSFSHISFDFDDHPMTLSGVLQGWLELTDLQIWVVRSAFYLGLVPLFAQLGSNLDVAPERFLFMSRQELAGLFPASSEIDRRMATYWADTEYLERNAVAPDRLRSIFEEAICRYR